MKYSLGLWLTLCLVGLQLVAVMTVVSSSYISSERVLLDHARSLLSDVAANTTAHSKGFLDPARGAAELAARLAENKIVSSEDHIQLEQLLFQQLQLAPQFAGVFYGDESGNFVYVSNSNDIGPIRSKIITYDQGSRRTELIWRNAQFEVISKQFDDADTFDPRSRPWYQNAKTELDSIWTDPYIFFTSQSPGITIASPVVGENGTVRGVIGVDIEISAISKFLADLKVGENGSALIVNRNSDVIAHPQLDLLKAENADGTFRFVSISEIADPIARRAFRSETSEDLLAVTQETYSKFTHEGETYVTMVLPEISEELPWTIAVYAPEKDFTGAIKQNRFNNVWIAAATALITGLIGLLLAKVIHKPVRAFAVRAALISQGEIDPTTPVPKTYKELDHVNQALTEQIKQRKNSEHTYGQTFGRASRGMAQISTQTGEFLRVNEKFAKIMGYEVNEVVELSLNDLTHPDDPSLFEYFADDKIEDVAINLEKRCIRKDGAPVWVNINAIMIRDSDGHPLHALVTVDEITKARAAEAKIQKLNRDLSHLARGELLGQMGAGLAHELNQPLTAITQDVDAALLTIRDASNADAELVQILNDLDEQAHRASDIIKALRGFARKGDKWKAPFDINELLCQTLRLVNAEALEYGIAINVEADALPSVLGFRVQVAQVIVNLVRNAIESIGASGGNKKEVRIIASLKNDMVEVAVEDTGPGVDPSIDLFGQFETTKSRGMGLGLSICRSIVEAGGGQIMHDESYAHGARFFFTVPIAVD
ncbi:MAG: cache domain-containing protein [Litoreibacter sp.]